jgi:hypothetical protein
MISLLYCKELNIFRLRSRKEGQPGYRERVMTGEQIADSPLLSLVRIEAEKNENTEIEIIL